MIYETIIIGGGPAGASAAIYAGRKKMKSLLLADTFGGQSVVSDSIENWIGTPKISGFNLAKNLEQHVRQYSDSVEIKLGEKVEEVKEDSKCGFILRTSQNNEFKAKTLIVASGGRHRKIGVPGEEKFDGRGVAYCSTCDAPLFRNKTVAVIGGGNSGLEAVVDLFPYASKIYLLNRDEELKGDKETQNQIKASEKTKIIHNVGVKEILGEKLVSGLKYQDLKSGEENKLVLHGVFIQIGSVPNSEFMGGLVKLNKFGEIIVDHNTGATSKAGIFAAGDVSDDLYKQNNIAAGDAVRSLLSAYNYINNIKSHSPCEA